MIITAVIAAFILGTATLITLAIARYLDLKDREPQS